MKYFLIHIHQKEFVHWKNGGLNVCHSMLLVLSDHLQCPRSCSCYLSLVMASIHLNGRCKLFILGGV